MLREGSHLEPAQKLSCITIIGHEVFCAISIEMYSVNESL